MTKFIGFDTETVIRDGVHRFFSFQVYSEDFNFGLRKRDEIINFIHYDPNELLIYLTEKTDRAWFVCFNLAFDGMVLSEMLKGRGYEVKLTLAGSRMIRVTVRKNDHKWVFCDLRNVMTIGSLDNVGDVLKIQKMKKPDYLGKRAPETLEERIYFERYAMRDAEICYKGARSVYEEFKTWRSTCAALAMRVYKRDFAKFKKFANYPDVLNDKFRLSYHGGRTECFIRGTNFDEVLCYDVNSLYPFVMRNKDYPNVFERFVSKHDVNLDHEGIAKCDVSIDAFFPPLSIKRMTKDKIDKLIFPNGRFVGYFTYPELRAVEDLKVGKINEVLESYEWRGRMNPFKEYVDHFYELKRAMGREKSAKKSMYKILLNGLYGKFGEHGEVRFIELDGSDIKSDQLAKPRRAFYHSVPIASYITAYSRLELLKWINKCHEDHVYYADTDSVYTTDDLTSSCSEELGALKLEGHVSEGEAVFIRSKFYLFGDKITLKGFTFKENADVMKLNIFNNKLGRFEHRILKFLESERIHKIPLTDYYQYKNFSVEADGKRDFEKKLDNKSLLVEAANSEPIKAVI